MSESSLRLVTKRDENVNWLHGTIVDDSQEYPYSQIATLSHDLDWEGNMAIALVLVASFGLLAACEAAYEKLVTAHGHDGGCGENPDNPLPRQLKAAIDKAKGSGD